MSADRLKQAWWKARVELSAIGYWLVEGLPGSFGSRLRNAVMRSRLKGLGPNTTLQRGFRVTNPELVSIGSNCNLAQGVFITGGGGVTIGDWVGFGPDTKIWSVNHRYEDPDRPWLQQGWERKPVEIEDDVWLGANVFVMPGVRIGRGSIVSAGAVVTKTIPEYALVAGNPARVVGWRKQPPSPREAAPGASETGMKGG